MCGIAGFIDYRSKSDENILQRMTDALAHRGPDGSGTVCYQNAASQAAIGLGHRRLSIIDLTEGGKQPKHFANRWHIVFNGELYNYKEVRADLKKLGYVFQTQSDTEVLLQAFDCWGAAALQRFIGMFAFALYDEKKHKLYLVRDRAGVKPLYVYQRDGLILFASELKAFHQHPHFQKEIDTDSLATFFTYGYILAPFSIFKNTTKVEQGHFLEIDLTSQTIDNQCYWDATKAYQKDFFSKKEQTKITQSHNLKTPISKSQNLQSHNLESTILDETERLLRSACEYRMVADVPVGMFLSGGYDSSLVTALLQTNRTERLKTFTIGFAEKGFDEAPFAKKVAQHLGTDHTEHYCTVDDAFEILPDLPYFYDEPFGDASAIPTTLVSSLAREQVTVSLSADAGDEVFAGYGKYVSATNIVRKFSPFPQFARVGLSRLLQNFDPENFHFLHGLYNFTNRYGKITDLLRGSNPADMLTVLAETMPSREQKRLLKQPFAQQNHAFSRAKNIEANDPLNAMLALDYITYLPDDILTKVDRATMSVSLEGREPLLDHRLLEWAATLRGDLKMKNGVQKYLLKEITHRYLPKELMDRPKMGFAVPIQLWFKDRLRPYLDEYLSEQNLAQHELLDTSSVLKLKQAYLDGKPLNINVLWNILMFQMWYKKWMS